MEQLNALQILEKTRAQLEDDHKLAQMYDKAIAEVEGLQAENEFNKRRWNELAKELQAPKTCEHCKFSGYFSPHESLECLNNDCNFYSVDVDLNDGCNKFEPKDTK